MIKKKNRFYVYILRRPDNFDPYYRWLSQPFYVGKGEKKRIKHHRKDAKAYLKYKKDCYYTNPRKINIILYLWRMGLDFEEETLFDNLTEEEAFELENKMILFYGREIDGGILSNLDFGLTGCSKPDDIKKKMSEARMGIKFTEEHCEHISQGKKLSLALKLINRLRQGDFACVRLLKTFERLKNFIPDGITTGEEIEKFKLEWSDIKKKNKKTFLCDEVLKCPTCGSDFKRRNYQETFYCSKECFYKSLGKKFRRSNNICLQCGESFYPEYAGKKYCSPECYHLSQVGQKRSDETRKKQSEANQKRKERGGFKKKNHFEEKPCELCGKPFMPRDINENKKRKYCSTDCQHKAKVGSTHTEETKQKLRKPKSEEHKKKQSEAMTGRKRTRESIEKGLTTVACKKAERESQQFSLNLDKVSNG